MNGHWIHYGHYGNNHTTSGWVPIFFTVRAERTIRKYRLKLLPMNTILLGMLSSNVEGVKHPAAS